MGTLGVRSWLSESGREPRGPRVSSAGHQASRPSPPVSNPRHCPQPGCRGFPSPCPRGPLHYDSLGSRSTVPGGSTSDVCAKRALTSRFWGGRVHCPKLRGLEPRPTWRGWTSFPRRPSYRLQFCPQHGAAMEGRHPRGIGAACALGVHVGVVVPRSLGDGCQTRCPAGLQV